jgi:hypothetical protein
MTKEEHDRIVAEVEPLARQIMKLCHGKPTGAINGALGWMLSEALAQLNGGNRNAAKIDLEMFTGMVSGMIDVDCDKIQQIQQRMKEAKTNDIRPQDRDRGH